MPPTSPVRPALRPWLIGAAVVSVVIHLASLYDPSPDDGGLGLLDMPHLDKVVHALLFGVPVLLAAAAGLPWRRWALVLAVHAPVSEVVQHLWLPHRSGDPRDVVADLTGIVVAVALVAWLLPPTTPAHQRRSDDAALTRSGAGSHR